MIALIIILSLLIVVLCYTIWNLLKKVEKYEETVIAYEENIVLFQKYYTEIVQAIEFSDQKLKIVDHRGTFKSDDEIGFFFKFIQDLQTLMNSFDYTKPRLADSPKSPQDIIIPASIEPEIITASNIKPQQ